MNCAHVKIVNEGKAVTPGDEYLVKIPGVYVRGQPGKFRVSFASSICGEMC